MAHTSPTEYKRTIVSKVPSIFMSLAFDAHICPAPRARTTLDLQNGVATTRYMCIRCVRKIVLTGVKRENTVIVTWESRMLRGYKRYCFLQLYLLKFNFISLNFKSLVKETYKTENVVFVYTYS